MRKEWSATVVILLVVINLLTPKIAHAQNRYKRIVNLVPEGEMIETIELYGRDSGTFSFGQSGAIPHGNIPFTDTGNWIKSKITHFKSQKKIPVVILNYGDTTYYQYYELEQNGNLKRIHKYGVPFSKNTAYTFRKQ